MVDDAPVGGGAEIRFGTAADAQRHRRRLGAAVDAERQALRPLLFARWISSGGTGAPPLMNNAQAGQRRPALGLGDQLLAGTAWRRR